jgi:hypothetical protein
LEVDYLDEMIVQWLIDNYHRPGYGGLLKALTKNLNLWNRLISHGFIPQNVLKDFQIAQNSAVQCGF